MHEITSHTDSPWQLICTCASAWRRTGHSIRKKIQQYSFRNKQCLVFRPCFFFPTPSSVGCSTEVLDTWSLNLEWMIKARDNSIRREKETGREQCSALLHAAYQPHTDPGSPEGTSNAHGTETNSRNEALEKEHCETNHCIYLSLKYLRHWFNTGATSIS